MKRPFEFIFVIFVFLIFTTFIGGEFFWRGGDAYKNRLISKTFPAEINFLLADYKYNDRDGIKICEIQQVSLSSLSGYDFLYGGKGLVAEKVCNVLSQYQETIWFIEEDICDHTFREKFRNNNWIPINNVYQLFHDVSFRGKAAIPPKDPYNLQDYHGILYGIPSSIGSVVKFREKYPGIIILDARTFPYWIDKYKMNSLFAENHDLEKFKPKWRLYPKKYSENSAQSIVDDFNRDAFVIKPRGAFRGDGIIIVEKKDLDHTLNLILGDKNKLKEHSDPAYTYWASDLSDSFLVEEFVESNTITVPHLNNQRYDGTLRSVFLLLYHKKEVQVVFLETHWKIPKKPLSDEGTWNDKHKSSGGQIPHYSKVDSDVREKVEEQLKEALLLFYRQLSLQTP